MRICFVLAVAAISGCATPYGPVGRLGGYSHLPAGDDAYVVSFAGNGFTSPEQASDMALLRASEIAIQLGYCCLSVEIRQDGSSVTASSVTTSGHASRGNFSATTYANQVYRPGVHLGVRMFHQRPDGKFLELYNAAETAARLRSKWGVESSAR